MKWDVLVVTIYLAYGDAIDSCLLWKLFWCFVSLIDLDWVIQYPECLSNSLHLSGVSLRRESSPEWLPDISLCVCCHSRDADRLRQLL